MTEDEATTVADLAAECVWGGRRHWGLIMRYGRLFRPGTDAGGGAYPMVPALAGKNAYRRAMDRGLLYAEGYACVRGAIITHSAWCLDGETVVDPGFKQPRTAYFGWRCGRTTCDESMRHDAKTTVETASSECSFLLSRSIRRWIRAPTSLA